MILKMVLTRSSSRLVACFMVRPILPSMNAAMGTMTKNSRVSRQLIMPANTTQVTTRSGSATSLPIKVLVPLPSASMSLVKRDIRSAVPRSLNWLTSWRKTCW